MTPDDDFLAAAGAFTAALAAGLAAGVAAEGFVGKGPTALTALGAAETLGLEATLMATGLFLAATPTLTLPALAAAGAAELALLFGALGICARNNECQDETRSPVLNSKKKNKPNLSLFLSYLDS